MAIVINAAVPVSASGRTLTVTVAVVVALPSLAPAQNGAGDDKLLVVLDVNKLLDYDRVQAA